MKIAILMQCHKNPEQINMLLDVLDHPVIDVFIHIDKKAQDIKEKIKQRQGVFILPKQQCVDVQWGMYSQVRATLKLLKAAGGKYDYYCLISGQDYPIQPIDNLIKFLEINKGSNFIECKKIKSFNKRNDVYFSNVVIGKQLWKKFLKNLLVFSTGGWQNTYSIFKRKAPYDFKYWFGSSWWCLHNDVIMWINDFLNKHSNYENFFQHSLCPDECFFQTLVMNSPYADNVKPFLHYIKWEDGKSSPKTLTIADKKAIMSSRKFFARKFDIYI
jgi:hypothetical protein